MISDYTAPIRFIRNHPKELTTLYAFTAAAQLVTGTNPNGFDALISAPVHTVFGGAMTYVATAVSKDCLDFAFFNRGGINMALRWSYHNLNKPLISEAPSSAARRKLEWQEIIADQPRDKTHQRFIKVSKACVVGATIAALVSSAATDCSAQNSCFGGTLARALLP